MARWPQQKQENGVTTPSDDAPAKLAAPKFDPSKPFTDAHEQQQKYWVQNGWLYRRGTAEPVREV